MLGLHDELDRASSRRSLLLPGVGLLALALVLPFFVSGAFGGAGAALIAGLLTGGGACLYIDFRRRSEIRRLRSIVDREAERLISEPDRPPTEAGPDERRVT